MTQQNRYIIYRANWDEDKGWQTFTGSRSLTGILAEHFFSSGQTPEIGDRLGEHKTDEDGKFYARVGDWVVDRVESYVPDLPVGTEFTEVVICFCKYDPIEPEWIPQGKSIVSLDSFGGDLEAFQNWLDTADTSNYRVFLPKDLMKSR